MSLAFITVKNNAVIGANIYIPVIPDRNAFTVVLDDTDNGVKDLLSDVNSHLFSDVMGSKPYLTATYDGINVTGALVNAPSSVPSQVAISLIGQIHQVPITNGQFTFPINLHPAVTDQHLTLNIRVDGFPYTFMEIAGRNSNVENTIYQDTNGVNQVVPVKNADLANYWQNNLVDMSWSSVDLATADGIAIHTLFHYVLPALNLTLTASEQAGLIEIQNNLLPSLSTTLANVSDGTNLDIHYNSYKLHTQQAKIAMDRYVADRMEISKYITLK
jgi:hypothetical protein